MNVIENNRLIAEFMGFNPEPFSNEGGSGFDLSLNGVPEKGYMSYRLATYGTLQENINKILDWPFFYHTSWDWLMPVWRKCVDVIALWVVMHGTDNQKEHYKEVSKWIEHFILCVSIENVQKRISELIQWYNTTQSK